MKRIKLPSPAMVIGIIALIAATTGSAVATTSLITSAKIKNHTIKLVDISTSAQNSLKKGKTGPIGPSGHNGSNGAVGPTGPTGPAGPGARWAVINADGTIEAQSGGITVVDHSAPGWFYLEFAGATTTGKTVSANTTWRGSTQAGQSAGAAQVDKCGGDMSLGQLACSAANDSNGVFVQTQNAAGTVAAERFYVSVY